MAPFDTHSHGPGPFITHRTTSHRDGGLLVANSRRHRKGLSPHRVSDPASAHRPRPSHSSAFCHWWAPRRLAWWIALSFMLGASLFTLGGFAAAWPSSVATVLQDPDTQGRIFAVGAVFFTTAAYLQWLEAINGDVADALGPSAAHAWRWFGWRPHNLGYLASGVQLVGTVMFNFNTLDALIPGLGWQQLDRLVWTPNMIGCACFLVASVFAYLEVGQGKLRPAPRSISWWIAVINLLGSLAFQVSALYSLALPSATTGLNPQLASAYTAIGGLCFFLGAYLMVPELFDEGGDSGNTDNTDATR